MRFIEDNETTFLMIQPPTPLWVETPLGFQPIEWLIRIPQEPTVVLTFASGVQLTCSRLHLLSTHQDQLVYAKDSLHQRIRTNTALLDRVVSVIPKEIPETCFDLQVKGHLYYTNSFLSHNSTISAIFLLHYILFNADKTVAILANKAATAKEILHRIKNSYQNLPKFLQQGVLEWNKGSIELENGSRIFASSSSASNIRGQSINVLYLDECLAGNSRITVRNKETQEIQTLSIEAFLKQIL